MRRSNRAVLACAAVTLAVLGLDLGTKAWAQHRLADGPPIVLVEGGAELVYAENPGAAFSILRDAPVEVRTAVFGIAALAASIVLLVLFARGRGGALFAAGVPLIVAGALGNLTDRVRHGYVVDFLHAHWRGVFDYPVFNVADIAIFVGVALLVIDSFREGGRAESGRPALAGGPPR